MCTHTIILDDFYSPIPLGKLERLRGSWGESMTYAIATGNVVRVISLGAVSYLALSLDFASGQKAFAQSNLPPVTVDAPGQQRARPAAQRSQTSASRVQRRVAAPAPRRVEPVPYVTPSTGTLGAPPAPYAGGQVATGGSLGLLGNRSVMDTPFNQTSYTAELIENQQARTIRDVLMNDPSVRVIQAAGGGADSLFIRGFYYDSGDYWTERPLRNRAVLFHRSEFHRAGRGPQRAERRAQWHDDGWHRRFERRCRRRQRQSRHQACARHRHYAADRNLRLQSRSSAQQVDVSRRYGEHKEWGVRLNSTYSNGNTPWNRQTDEFGNAVLGLDYRGENARVAVDVGYQADNLKPPLRFFGVLPGVTAIPPPPKAGTNFQVPWAYYAPTDFFSTVRGEVDVTDWVTAYAAFGYHDSNINYAYPSPTITNAPAPLGGLASRPFAGKETFETLAGEAGVRANRGYRPDQSCAECQLLDQRPNLYPGRPGFRRVRSSGTSTPSRPTFPNRASPRSWPISCTNVNLESVGVSDTMSMWNKRVQLTVGVRHQTGGKRSHELSAGRNRAGRCKRHPCGLRPTPSW